MTGQVKEDVLSRIGELGVFVKDGKINFNPRLLRASEFVQTAKKFHYTTISKEHTTIDVEKGSLCFTYCQVPVIYKLANEEGLEVVDMQGSRTKLKGLSLDNNTSEKVFERTGEINQIIVFIKN